MPFLSWDKSYSVNVEEIDAQHRKLMEMINEFYEHVGDNSTKALRTLLESLVEYTRYHFATEEQYFGELDYPDAEAHKKLHQHFIDRVLDVKRRVDEGKHVVSFEITTFLKDWLMQHIKGHDKKYGAFLNNCGVF